MIAHLGRQPCAGARLLRRARADRRAPRHVAGREQQKIEATRAYGAEVDLEADGPAQAFDRLHELMDETGRPLRPPVRRPDRRSRARARSGSRSSRTFPTPSRRRPGRRRRADLGHRDRGQAGRRVVAVEPELSERCAAASRPASPSRRAEVRRRRPERALRRRACGRARPRARCRESFSSQKTKSPTGMRFLYGRAKLACEPAAAVASRGASRRKSARRCW